MSSAERHTYNCKSFQWTKTIAVHSECTSAAATTMTTMSVRDAASAAAVETEQIQTLATALAAAEMRATDAAATETTRT